MTQPPLEIQSPCVRNCCLDTQDMCLGCYRMLDEILIWGSANPQQQTAILQACAIRKLGNANEDMP